MSATPAASLGQPATTTTALKPVHTLILDAAPLLLNQPSLSTLLATSEILLTTQSVLDEIRDAAARARIEATYKPFLQLRSPRPESTKFVRDFARRTGDLAVMSNTDLELIALGYDVECERNGGDWRLRNAPGQRRLNGAPPQKETENGTTGERPARDFGRIEEQGTDVDVIAEEVGGVRLDTNGEEGRHDSIDHLPQQEQQEQQQQQHSPTINFHSSEQPPSQSDSDGEGWITPTNIRKHQAKDAATDATSTQPQKTLQCAVMTGDFAMQNVLLQINLNLLSTKTCKRVTQIKQSILRCHACFNTTRQMDKQFCPRCGQPTLTKVSCTTDEKGEVKLHLKTNMQWNNRGNVYSVPKPGSGSASQRWKGPKSGGGKGGWGNDLILAEDQKEYIRAVNRTEKKHDLMDQDVLPGILSGKRDGGVGGKVRIGAGRGVNSRKR